MAQALAQLAGEDIPPPTWASPSRPAPSALLPNGYQQLADTIEVPPQEVLLYLAVRESALIRLHKANPGCVKTWFSSWRYARGIAWT